MPILRPLLATALIAAPLAGPSWANPAMTPPPVSEWAGAEFVEGVAFQGDGSIKLESAEGKVPVLAFWRPILFKEETDKPIAGRMDCKIIGVEKAFTEAGFDPDDLHRIIGPARKRQGFRDMDVLRVYGEDTKQLDVVGRRSKPRQHYVLSYILVRDGERMIDIRRNCTFIYGDGLSKPDVLPYVYRYTKISYAFTPGAGA